MESSAQLVCDLKPGNVLLDKDIPKIADFGLACSHRIKPVTQSIEVRGTLAYTSPEQFLDMKGVDERADVYSLGKILFESVSGRIIQCTLPYTWWWDSLNQGRGHGAAHPLSSRVIPGRHSRTWGSAAP